MTVEASNDELQQEQIEIGFHERDLHKLLSTYVDAVPEFGCKTKTIYHEKTAKGKKGFNEWLHPDIVGAIFHFLIIRMKHWICRKL